MMRPALAPADIEFARMVRPILQDVKTRLIGLGSVALQPPVDPSSSLAGEARALADRTGSWMESAKAHRDTDAARLLLGGLIEIREWAEAAASHGMSGAVAAGLSDGYRTIREVADLVWHSELVPEGRTSSNGEETSNG